MSIEAVSLNRGLSRTLQTPTLSGPGGVRFTVRPVSTQNANAIDPTAKTADVTKTAPFEPIGPIERGRSSSDTARTDRATEGPRTGTAYQSNADGDSVTLNSKLDELTTEERAELQKLKSIDQRVRTHEEAHKAAAGALYRGGPTYEYQTGPDGQKYAVAGQVQIDTSPGRTPEETIAKAQQIRRAALAPADPSSTDRRVAANAAQMESKARSEMNLEQAESNNAPSETSDTRSTPNAIADAFNPRAITDRQQDASSPTAALRKPRLDLVA